MKCVTVLIVTLFLNQILIHLPLVFGDTSHSRHTDAVDPSAEKDSYTAAVYEHRPLVLRPLSRQTLEEGLDIYEQAVHDAAHKGADIVVFPEDGLMAFGMSRETIYPYLEILPPRGTITNPCDEAVGDERHAIQQRLSCIAKTYHVYLVANVGTVVFCSSTEPCPPDGRFQYNTNVVFDPLGYLISYYHKWSLFYETMFDFPPKPEYAVFYTPFGKFASIVCFDILFKEPAVELVEKYNVSNIIMPTAWGSKLPEMSGLGYHESWAIRMGVNLLTSELHFPELDFVGSGIYSGADGAISYSNKYKIFSSPELLVSNVPSSPKPCKISELESKTHPSNSLGNMSNFDTFQAEMQGNLFTFTLLTPDTNIFELFATNMSCYLEYRFKEKHPDDLYAFGIFEGLHISSLNSSIQVCALVRCAGTSQETCGRPTREAKSTFSHIYLQGQFSTNYIFPSVLINGGNLANDWNFTLDPSNFRGRIVANVTNSLLSVILYTRVFEQDDNIITRYYHNTSKYEGKGNKIDISSLSQTPNWNHSGSSQSRVEIQHVGGKSTTATLVPLFVFATIITGIIIIYVAFAGKARAKRYKDYELI